MNRIQMVEVFKLLQRYEQLSPGLAGYLESKLKCATFRRREAFLHERQLCRNIYFIVKGVARVAGWKDTGEYSPWLQQEGEIIISVDSYFRQVPSVERLIAESKLTVVYITFDEFQEACARWPEFAAIRAKLVEEYYCRSRAWDAWLNSTPKTERYQKFVKEQPVLAARVTDKVLASYLQIDYSYLKKHKKALMDKRK
jgi:CRP/FNR family transcriptional regulator, anaerobic regulatory protein